MDVKLKVFAVALDVDDVGEVDSDVARVGFDEDASGCLWPGFGAAADGFEGSVGGPLEVGQGVGLEEVVDGTDAVAFDGILLVSGGEHYGGCVGEAFDEVHAVEVGHVDVSEDEVDGVGGEEIEGVEGVVAGGCEGEEGSFVDVAPEFFEGYRFVVNHEGSQVHGRGVKVQRYRCRVCM